MFQKGDMNFFEILMSRFFQNLKFFDAFTHNPFEAILLATGEAFLVTSGTFKTLYRHILKAENGPIFIGKKIGKFKFLMKSLI